MANNDLIASAMGISPMVEPGVVEKMVGSVEVLPAIIPDKPSPQDAIRDFDKARKNILEVIEVSKVAIADVSNLAEQSQDADYYDSLTSSLKVMLEANRDLMELHNQIRKLTVAVEDKVNKVQNNLFVGSTSDLQKFIQDLQKVKTIS